MRPTTKAVYKDVRLKSLAKELSEREGRLVRKPTYKQVYTFLKSIEQEALTWMDESDSIPKQVSSQAPLLRSLLQAVVFSRMRGWLSLFRLTWCFWRVVLPLENRYHIVSIFKGKASLGRTRKASYACGMSMKGCDYWWVVYFLPLPPEQWLPGAFLAQRPLVERQTVSLQMSDSTTCLPVLLTRTEEGWLMVDGSHRLEAAR